MFLHFLLFGSFVANVQAQQCGENWDSFVVNDASNQPIFSVDRNSK